MKDQEAKQDVIITDLKKLVDQLNAEIEKLKAKLKKMQEHIDFMKAQLEVPGAGGYAHQIHKTDPKLIKTLEAKIHRLEQQLEIKNKALKTLSHH